MVTSTARQRVLELIQQRGPVSAAQIGLALDMSAAAVRHHLSILRRDGRIVVVRADANGKRGRPERSYRLSDRLLGENFGELAEVLMGIWLAEVPPHRRGASLDEAGQRLAARAGIPDGNQAASKRLVELVERLNGKGYQARWEAGARGPRIVLGHCPYAAIIEAHPELCQIDAAFLQTLGNAEVQQIAKIDAKQGVQQCIFAMGVRPRPAAGKAEGQPAGQ